ncbi:MAG: hypothetical protein UX03_C0022G0012 [Candidatus Woesebacteria bacterium GW2011_GWE1_45_18]|uniref:Uncharacterized protein n=2 Tax=Candidatus Woeseibacteriota TaxID=1752722 RepID=A0A0G1PCM3_9BACT|nr:MAG: hypothetical protein UX03_C0022G0012 [Candidatus Woesebacteria bacterium GW2011_GWE1_45_18]OGM89022.1 MAG: hypothetical protein A2597_00925 [Candidatus Woesebacteria bacterium RIFOXYD1_FULL_46_19]
MLTKTDLTAIDKIVQKRTGPLEKGQASLEKGQASLEKGQASLEKGQASLEKGLRRIEKKLDKTINFFDREHLQLRKRVETIEHKLEIPAPEF